MRFFKDSKICSFDEDSKDIATTKKFERLQDENFFEVRTRQAVLLVLIRVSAVLIRVSARAYLFTKKKSSEMCLYPEKNVLISGEKCADIQRGVFVSSPKLNYIN
jgi:hypothetical protein